MTQIVTSSWGRYTKAAACFYRTEFTTRLVLRKVGIRFYLNHLLHMTVTVRTNKKNHLVAVKNAYRELVNMVPEVIIGGIHILHKFIPVFTE